MNERAIFLEALDQAEPAERAAYLETACAGDTALRQRLEGLLKSHSEAEHFLDKLAPERVAEELGIASTLGATQDESPTKDNVAEELGFLAPSDRPDSLGRLGHYEILEVIGRGGMGSCYEGSMKSFTGSWRSRSWRRNWRPTPRLANVSPARLRLKRR